MESSPACTVSPPSGVPFFNHTGHTPTTPPTQCIPEGTNTCLVRKCLEVPIFAKREDDFFITACKGSIPGKNEMPPWLLVTRVPETFSSH